MWWTPTYLSEIVYIEVTKAMHEQPKNLAPKYIYVLLAIAFICIVSAIYKKKKMEARLQQLAYASAQLKLKENKPLTPTENISLGRSSFENIRLQAKKTVQLQPPPRPVLKPTANIAEIKAKTSTETVQAFSSSAFIDVPLPKNFNYSKLDLPDGFEGIYGVDDVSKAKVTGLAYKNTASAEQVSEFLKTDADSIPNLSKTPIYSMTPPQDLPPPPANSGFSKGTLWNGMLNNGESVAVVYMERADHKGSYLFVLSAPGDYFSKNDGAFDSLYDKARALNEKGQ